MTLNQKQIKYLRKLGHGLSPVVTVADRGLIETVINAINEALDIHELIKIKVRQDKAQRQKTYQKICDKTSAIEVQTIGMMLILYRPSKKAKIDLPGPKFNV